MSKIAEIHLDNGQLIIQSEPGAPIVFTGGQASITSEATETLAEPVSEKPSVTEMFSDYDNVVDAAIENDKSPKTDLRNRAISFGLNTYPGCALEGCVNDGKDILNYAVHSKVFSKSETRLITNERATRAAMWAGMQWALADAKPGDTRLIHYSGHGAQYAGDHAGFQPDHQHDVMCPIDFDWSEERMILDVQLFDLLKVVPSGVKVWILSDSCHSGNLLRAMPGKQPVRANKSRAYPWVPSHVKARLTKARENVTRALIGQTLDIGFGSGCRFDQTSADTQDEHGRPCGAFTHYLLRALSVGASKPFAAVIHDVNEALAHNGYDQRPQAKCARVNSPFLS